MPPKKQEQQNKQPYKPFFVLPIVLGEDKNIYEALSKPVNIKKDINKAKIIQILNDKGPQPFIEEGQISKQGRQFVCDNYMTVCEQTIQAVSKPADPKKDAKKDAKKQAKKEEPVADVEPPIQFDFDKKCNDFYFLLDFPASSSELTKIVKKGTKIDAIIIIKERVKPGSRKPNYSLLKNQRSINDMQVTLQQTTSSNKQAINNNTAIDNAKQMIRVMEHLIQQNQALSDSQHSLKNIKQCVVLNIEYWKDLSSPGKDQQNFMKALYEKLCGVTVDRQVYEEWRTKQKISAMIEPVKTTVQKQVQVQNPDKGKKGGKGTEPVFETVEEVVETKYESYPQNIKVQLTDYKITKQLILKSHPKLQSNPYALSLQSCVCLVSPNSSSSIDQKLQQISQKVQSKFKSKPLNKITAQILSKRVRQIGYPKHLGDSSQLKFEYEAQEAEVSLMQITQRTQDSAQSLKIEFIVHEMEKLATKRNSKIRWNFSDRKYVEKFSSESINGIINQELQNDPEIYTGFLETEGIRLLVMTRTNPPGRVLYHNDIFDWKVLPDFQHWLPNQKIFDTPSDPGYFDYQSQKAGNLSICSKYLMPRDNSIIRDMLWTVGSRTHNLIEVSKNNAKFGLTKISSQNNAGDYIYWHQLDQQYFLRVNRKVRVIKEHCSEEKQQQNAKNQQKQQGDKKQGDKPKTKEKTIQSTDLTIQSKGQYMIVSNPYPTIFWYSPTSKELKRSFGANGQITSYLRDGSISIMYPNANISTYRNSIWTITKNNIVSSQGSQRQLNIETTIQGQSQILMRQDQTIIIKFSNGNSKIVFPDQTEMIYDKKTNSRTIRYLDGPLIRIHLARDNNLNVIGHGSAFAYLGFQNILERSYDGYLFEVFDADITSHYYIQAFDLQGKTHYEQMRLVTFRDSTIIRIQCTTGHVIYLSPSCANLLTEQYLNERWLQLFTTPSYHGEGVFDIDLNQGQIETKDSQTNKFIAKINEKSQVKIAVSFVKEDEEEEDARSFGNGFHVKQQNYFLPPPANFMPARLFSLHSDGGGVQYLNQSQITGLEMYNIHEQYKQGKIIRQYTKQMNKNSSFLGVGFSRPVDIGKFGLPDLLRAAQTKKSLTPYVFPEIKHRVIEEIPWNSDYSRVLQLTEEITRQRNQREDKLTTIKTNRTPKPETP